MRNDKKGASRSTSSSGLLLTAVSISALAAYLLMNHPMLIDLYDQLSDRAAYKTLIYLLWVGLGFAAFFGVLVTASAPVLAALFAMFCVSVTINYAYAVISEIVITPDSMEWTLHEFSQLPQAWAEFWPEIAVSHSRSGPT